MTKIGYENLKPLQNRMYEMLKVIDSFCKENNIKYFLDGGTALGAYRHHGFIPWDDDLDIGMDINEYKRFCKLFIDNPPQGLVLQTHKTEKNYINGFAKVRDLNSELEEKSIGVKYKYNGLFIDVFPYECAFPALIAVAHILYKPLFMLTKYHYDKYKIISFFVNLYYFLIVGITKIFRAVSRFFCSHSYSYSYGCNTYTNKRKFKKNLFEQIKRIQFEKSDFPIPQNIEDYLTILYGNYMQLPPFAERQPVHSLNYKIYED